MTHQMRWAMRMAWQDSRRSRGRLLLFSCAVAAGVAALVAVAGFGRSVQISISEQARNLLGADLVVSSPGEFTSEQERFLNSIGGEQAREVAFATMLRSEKKGRSARLVQVRGIEVAFPFYGQIETVPPNSVEGMRASRGVLADSALVSQMGLEIGDTVALGTLSLPLWGTLTRAPGEGFGLSTLAPRVYVAMPEIYRAQLLKGRTMVRYHAYFKFPRGTDTSAAVAARKRDFEKLRLTYETARDRETRLGTAWKTTAAFLNLTALFAALLGVTGIAGAMQLHIAGRSDRIAVLRCIGTKAGLAFTPYWIQAVAVGVAGGVAGAAVGGLLQFALPVVLSRFILLEVRIVPVWDIAIAAVVLAGCASYLSCLPAFIRLKLLSPFDALRPAPPAPVVRRDRWAWAGYLLVLAVLVAFSLFFAPGNTPTERLVFAGICTGVIATLALLAAAMMRLVRWLTPARLSYPVRHGLANLWRPGNRTHNIAIAIGFSVFLLATAAIVHQGFEKKFLQPPDASQGNALFFDLQPDQIEPVRKLLQGVNLPVLEQAPVVPLRLVTVRGRALEEWLADPARALPSWAVDRDYRVSYRETLTASEKIVAGQWHARWNPSSGPLPVSVEQGLARNLGLSVGDPIEFSVQGATVKAVVASFRKVDWMNVRPNFEFIFPAGVLEDTPTTYMISTRAASPAQSLEVQTMVSSTFSNVTSVDLSLAMAVVEDISRNVQGGARFLSGFLVVVGLVVLLASVSASQAERVRECVLLRTLGASGRVIRRIYSIEFVSLGCIAAASGLALALGSAWILSVHVFAIPFAPPLPVLATLALAVPLFTAMTGLVATRDVFRKSPMDLLRSGAA